jgi:16S rRNA (cytidine1402-2'-O)-methyltransferase
MSLIDVYLYCHITKPFFYFFIILFNHPQRSVKMDRTEEKNKVEGGRLYLVATPIGNLADISERALKVLSEVDFVAAEDTRNSGLMLSRLGIKRPLISYHEHNKAAKGGEIADRLAAGESCALISDAGTPAISDPGEDLVRLCAERGIPVSSIPGACAAITALTLSALATRRFCFEGFIPTASKERRARLEAISSEERTQIIYEAPHKLRKTLDELLAVCGGERKIALCRELTKLNEEALRMTLSEAVGYYAEKEPRGEYVLVLEGAQKSTDSAISQMSIREHLEYYISEGMPTKDAIKTVAKERGLPKNEVYAESLKMKSE